VFLNIFAHVDSIGFWRWCITHRINGFSDFVHCLDSKELEKKHDILETGSVIEVSSFWGTQQSRCLPSPEDGNWSNFRNVMFFIFQFFRILTMDKVWKPINSVYLLISVLLDKFCEKITISLQSQIGKIQVSQKSLCTCHRQWLYSVPVH
jgi:hypothetical protein